MFRRSDGMRLLLALSWWLIHMGEHIGDATGDPSLYYFCHNLKEVWGSGGDRLHLAVRREPTALFLKDPAKYSDRTPACCAEELLRLNGAAEFTCCVTKEKQYFVSSANAAACPTYSEVPIFFKYGTPEKSWYIPPSWQGFYKPPPGSHILSSPPNNSPVGTSPAPPLTAITPTTAIGPASSQPSLAVTSRTPLMTAPEVERTSASPTTSKSPPKEESTTGPPTTVTTTSPLLPTTEGVANEPTTAELLTAAAPSSLADAASSSSAKAYVAPMIVVMVLTCLFALFS